MTVPEAERDRRDDTEVRHRHRRRVVAQRAWAQLQARRQDVVGLALVVTLTLIAQLLFLRPPALSDQLDYFSTADQLPDVSPTHRHLRLGLLLPVRLLIIAFEYSELAYYAVPVASFIALGVATYCLARLLTGSSVVGLGSGLLVTLNPYVIWESSYLLPDVPAGALLAAALACMIWAGSRGRPHSRMVILATFVAGILLGWSYLHREFIILFFPLAALVWRLYGLRWKHLAATVLGSLSMLAVELSYGWVVYASPFIRWTTASGPRTTDREFAVEPLQVVATLPEAFLYRAGGWIWTVMLALSVALPFVWRSARRRPVAIVVTAWAAGMWLTLTAIGLLPALVLGEDRVLLRLHKIRYWFPLFPAIAVGGVAAIWAIARLVLNRVSGSVSEVVASALALSVVVSTSWYGVSSISGSSSWVRNGSNEFRELRAYLTAAHPDAIWLTEGQGRAASLIVPMYTRTWYGQSIWHGDMLALRDASGRWATESDLTHGMLLHHSFGFSWFTREEPGPTYLSSWPDSWSPSFVSSNGSLGLVDVDPPAGTVTPTSPGTSWQLSGITDQSHERDRGFNAEVQAGERLRALDGRANGLRAGMGQEILADVDRLVVGQLELEVEGERDARVRCLFHDSTGDRSLVDVLSYRDGNQAVSSFSCRPPPGSDPVSVRLHVDVLGPVVVDLKEVHLSWVDPPT